MSASTGPIQGSFQKQETTPQMIHLQIEDGGALLELPLDKPISLGRESGSDSYTTIDLTDMGGADKGVARYHARIMKENGALSIVDLGSLKGTFINACPLVPFVPQPITHDDYLHLGKLLIHVKIP